MGAQACGVLRCFQLGVFLFAPVFAGRPRCPGWVGVPWGTSCCPGRRTQVGDPKLGDKLIRHVREVGSSQPRCTPAQRALCTPARGGCIGGVGSVISSVPGDGTGWWNPGTPRWLCAGEPGDGSAWGQGV